MEQKSTEHYYAMLSATEKATRATNEAMCYRHVISHADFIRMKRRLLTAEEENASLRRQLEQINSCRACRVCDACSDILRDYSR